MRIGAGAHAGIAARAFFEIQNQQALRFHEPLRQEPVEGNICGLLQTLAILLQISRGDRFQAAAAVGKRIRMVLVIHQGSF